MHRHSSRAPLSRLWLQSWADTRSSQGFSLAGPFPWTDIIPTPKCEHFFHVTLLRSTQRYLFSVDNTTLERSTLSRGRQLNGFRTPSLPLRRKKPPCNCHIDRRGPVTPGHCCRERISLGLHGASQSLHSSAATW